MERTEIKKTVDALLVDLLGISESEIRDEADLREDFGCDSLDCVEIIMSLEKEFAIAIPDEKAEGCRTVAQVYDLVGDVVNR